MEESPEQILARLVRYRDSLNREASSASVDASQQTVEPSWRRGRSAVLATVFGQFLAVLGCALAVVAFEQLDTTIALGLVVAAAAVGLTAAWRRVPFALWWTAGVVIGGVLGAWS